MSLPNPDGIPDEPAYRVTDGSLTTPVLVGSAAPYPPSGPAIA